MLTDEQTLKATEVDSAELDDDKLDEVTGGLSQTSTTSWGGYHSSERGNCPYCGAKGVTILRDSIGNYKCDKCHKTWRKR